MCGVCVCVRVCVVCACVCVCVVCACACACVPIDKEYVYLYSCTYRTLYLEATINDSHSRMYIIPGVSESTLFEPKTRKEIRVSL